MHSIKTCIVTTGEPDLALSFITIKVIAFIILTILSPLTRLLHKDSFLFLFLFCFYFVVLFFTDIVPAPETLHDAQHVLKNYLLNKRMNKL